jgi:lysyl-tRNA synthetase class I
MELATFLTRSAATDAFKDAVETFLATGRPNTWIVFDRRSPSVKVERTLIQLLATRPELAIECVEIDGRSGCEKFDGTIDITTLDGPVRIRFEWNCRWKAEQLGWTDWFGFPDQARAAREFGYDCFHLWDEAGADELSVA